MRKYLLSAAAVAVVAGIGSVALLSGMFDKDISAPFATNEVDLPKILLLPAEAKECQRRRVNDTFGHIIDNVDLNDGSTRVVTFKKYPVMTSEMTYYPVEGRKDCDSFVKDGARTIASTHGPLFTSIERDDTGFRPLRERKFTRDGKLISAGNLVASGAKFQTDFYTDQGLIKRSETFNFEKKGIESETLYRANGTALVRQKLNPTETYFSREHFNEAGTTVSWAEDRSYGNYHVTYMNSQGTPETEFNRSNGYVQVRLFNANATLKLEVHYWSDHSVRIAHYDGNGDHTFTSKWREGAVGPKDNAGFRPLVLTEIIEEDAKGRPVRDFYFDDEGRVTKLYLHRGGEFFKNRTDYAFDDKGVVVSSKNYSDKGDEQPEVKYERDPGLRFQVNESYRVLPRYTVPLELFKYDALISTEVYQGHGGM